MRLRQLVPAASHQQGAHHFPRWPQTLVQQVLDFEEPAMQAFDLCQVVCPGGPLSHNRLKASQLLGAPSAPGPFFSQRCRRLASISSNIALASTVAYVKGWSPSVFRAVRIPAASSSSTASWVADARRGRGQGLLDLFTHLADLGLPAFAPGRFDLLVSLEGGLRGVAQHVELAHLVGDLRPQLLNCQAFTRLRITDRPQHVRLSGHSWSEQRHHSPPSPTTSRSRRPGPVRSSASRTTSIGSVPFSGWMPSPETLMPPCCSTCASHSRSSLASLLARHVRAVRFKQIQDLAPRDPDAQGG